MTLQALNHAYDAMQMEYGDPNLRSIYYGGYMESPDLCFVFMNPTGKNIASDPAWKTPILPQAWTASTCCRTW